MGICGYFPFALVVWFVYDGSMKIYSFANVIILILIITALVIGYLIFQQRISSQKNLPAPISSPLDAPDASTTTSVQETAEEEFTIFIGPETKIFGVDQGNPYTGEPPVGINIGADAQEFPDLSRPFEISGDVFTVDLQEQVIRITSDYPRNIGTEFTPRGPQISLEDIKEGDRIVASDNLDEEGLIDYRDIKFIQVLPPK